MPDETIVTTKPKRTRKPSATKRVRQPKPQAILDIEKQAADLKAKYRQAQSSSGVLKRIQKLAERLTDEHRTILAAQLQSKTETLPLAMPAGERLPLRPETSDGRLRAEEAP